MWCLQFAGQPHSEECVEQLGEAGIEDLRIGAIWPQPEVDPEKLGMKGLSGEGVDLWLNNWRNWESRALERHLRGPLDWQSVSTGAVATTDVAASCHHVPKVRRSCDYRVNAGGATYNRRVFWRSTGLGLEVTTPGYRA